MLSDSREAMPQTTTPRSLYSCQMLFSMSETSDGHCGHQVANSIKTTGEPSCSERR